MDRLIKFTNIKKEFTTADLDKFYNFIKIYISKIRIIVIETSGIISLRYDDNIGVSHSIELYISKDVDGYIALTNAMTLQIIKHFESKLKCSCKFFEKFDINGKKKYILNN